MFPSYSYPAFSILLSSLTSTQGKSAAWSRVQRSKRHVVQTLSRNGFLWNNLTSVSLSPLHHPLHSPWSIRLIHPQLFDIPQHHILICTLTPKTPFSSVTICIPPTLLLFWYAIILELFLSVCMYFSISFSFIVHAVQSDRLDKCGGMVTQTPEASERAKINHVSLFLFISYLSSFLFCSSVHSILFVIFISPKPFNISFLF